jgi:hypothetical protein
MFPLSLKRQYRTLTEFRSFAKDEKTLSLFANHNEFEQIVQASLEEHNYS